VFDADGNELLAWQPEPLPDRELPAPATEPLPPEQIASIEELYLTGLHLEQYRHATRSPEAYWGEGLRREPNDARLNNAIGLRLLRKGCLAEAEQHFERAVRRLTFRNSNPYDGEPSYNLGLARLYQGNEAEAYTAFHKAVWNYAWQSAGYFWLAAISQRRGEFALALEQIDRSLSSNESNLSARALKASVLRRIGRAQEASELIDETLALDPLCFRMMAERFLLTRDAADMRIFVHALAGDVQTLLDLAYELAWSGQREDALLLLESCCNTADFDHPLLGYTSAWLAVQLGREAEGPRFISRAEVASPLYCFPARLEEMIVLEDAIARQPDTARAHYYLGNLYYDKQRYEDAIRHWRRSVDLDSSYSIPWRNLGLAEFNVLHDAAAADRMYARAFSASPRDARLLYEWDQLKKRAGLASPEDRLRMLEQHPSLVEHRDDLTVEFITLLNEGGRPLEALRRLESGRFSPWEGGEGLVSAQYVVAHQALGRAALVAGNATEALEHFEAARRYPENLGEGKHLLTLERDLDYFCGLAAERLGDTALAQKYWRAAAAPLPSIGSHSFFQALAMQKLENSQKARAVLSELAEFARAQSSIVPKIDYFATSLPNFLLFDDDVAKRNHIKCAFLRALAHYGLGESAAAHQQLECVLAEDPNHLTALEIARWAKSEVLLVPAKIEVESMS
jgi:tetratricopeptide (TPR) repeat protein